MKTKYHVQISREVLSTRFSKAAVKKIILANILQDRIKNQIGHHYIHFDSNSFGNGYTYLGEQKHILFSSIENGEYKNAWGALGHILHSWQDFYSHSNYISLWLTKTENPSPEAIIPDDPAVVNSSELRSGKNYGIMEYFAMIPIISKFITPLMPEDSHAKMNLDSPEAGWQFEYAYNAAKKRTEDVVNKIFISLREKEISQSKIESFLGHPNN